MVEISVLCGLYGLLPAPDRPNPAGAGAGFGDAIYAAIDEVDAPGGGGIRGRVGGR